MYCSVFLVVNMSKCPGHADRSTAGIDRSIYPQVDPSSNGQSELYSFQIYDIFLFPSPPSRVHLLIGGVTFQFFITGK